MIKSRIFIKTFATIFSRSMNRFYSRSYETEKNISVYEEFKEACSDTDLSIDQINKLYFNNMILLCLP